MPRALLGWLLLALAVPRSLPPAAGPDTNGAVAIDAAGSSCITCHTGIEEIHPGYRLSCVDCHGGDDTAASKDKAHVLPQQTPPGDERVLPETWDLPWQRFRNPSNLRVVKQTCGICHERGVHNVLKSLHATTSGHLGDGFYEHGLSKSKKPGYGVFAIADERADVPPQCLKAIAQVPGFSGGAKDRIETHYTDLPRKACMQCHLWSVGRGVRGRVGMDGDYRGEGCAACHVTYGEDGRSRSADPTIDKLEPGHPLQHRFTSRIPTDTCAHCHYGDASIGLSFRGLSQLVPGMPAGPEVPGTTKKLLNGQFYQQNKDRTPPDVHHQRGMHCIDCHTQADVMGDGNLYPQMDHAVEIECSSCHGTFDAVADLTTSHGRRVRNLERRGDRFFLRSKVTGKEHEVVQVAHVLDPQRPEYNERAAAAMTKQHQRLECYACHAGWNVDFFGFHFDRNEQFTQLDLLSGKRTPGRVTTQEKVFATFDQLRLGINHEAMVAPYMVGFSTIGSVHDDKGAEVLSQATPVTAAELSGVTLVPHQPHTTQPVARQCVECHRSPATFGLGSVNFRLVREFAFAVDRRGLHTLSLDKKQPARTRAIAELEIAGEPRALALRLEPLHGHATHAYVGCADGTLAVVELKNPAAPRLVGATKELFDPHRMLAQGDHLYVADGAGGLAVFDLQQPGKPKRVGLLPTVQARALALQWPWLYLADGPGGLLVVDVADAAEPKPLASLPINDQGLADDVNDVAAFFQYSHLKALDEQAETFRRSRARMLGFVACGLDGLRLVDLTDPRHPRVLHGPMHERAFRGNRIDVRGVAVRSQFDLGSQGGGIETREHDWLFVDVEEGDNQNRQQYVYGFDVSDADKPVRGPGRPRVIGGNGRLLAYNAYNAPFLQHFLVAVGAGGIGSVLDSSKMAVGLANLTVWDDVPSVRDLAFEEFAFDRLQDERGRPEKDISHEGCRYLDRAAILTLLAAPVPIPVDEAGGDERLRVVPGPITPGASGSKPKDNK